MPSIVQISVSATAAAAPITLQSTGALISQGATNVGSGNYKLLTQPSDLTPLLATALNLSSLTWSGGTVVATTAAAIPGVSSGDTFVTTIAGATPTGYNGLVLATVTGANQFTFPLATNPGTETAAGSYTPPSQGELQSMVSTFFGQGTNRAVYVLELGAGDGTTGPSALGSWINTNPGIFYSYLVPRGWDGKANYLALVAQYNALSAKTYFFTTTTTGTYGLYPATSKCVLAEVESPGLPLTEFSLAADFQHTLAYAPSSVNRMTPNAFTFLNGVTPYPQQGTNAILTALMNANVNYVGTAAEGGLSNAALFWGDTVDGNDFSYWYSVDWIQLQSKQALANEVFVGSNNSLNPLWYDQSGVNRLQDRLVQVFGQAISFGLATGTVTRTTLDQATFISNFNAGLYTGQNVVNAIPFSTYTAANPNDFPAGKYAGFSAIYVPSRGFQSIVFGIDVNNLLAQ